MNSTFYYKIAYEESDPGFVDISLKSKLNKLINEIKSFNYSFFYLK